ncbi:MAG TPA: outer membrane beta-barrel protein [Xanthobacteraceae bacterium]|jgi:outer membrane immunogenic protein
MKKLLLATTAFVVLAAASANAADLARPAYAPPPPAYSWTGMYWGANIGYGWGSSKFDAALNATTLGGTALASTAISESQKIDGVIGGVQSGYNYQFGGWVWGWETDFQASGQKGGSTFAGVATVPAIALAVPYTVTTDHKLEWFGTARSRLGFLWSPNVLVYGTAGVAYGQVKDSAAINLTTAGGAVTANALATFKDWKAGWTAGAGIESTWGGGWSWKLEYLYIDLGKTEHTAAAALNVTGVGTVLATTANQTFRTTDNVVRLGLNYKWGGGGY